MLWRIVSRHWTRLLRATLIGCGILLGASTALAASKCKIAQVIELPITMEHLRPTIDVQINGKDAKFVLDSGAFYSMISSATATEYGLRSAPGPYGLRVTGIGGETAVRVATVREFTLVGTTLKNVEFLVGGSEVGNAGLLGQNLLENFDVEYDLAKGAIRLFRTEACEHAVLAYWLSADQVYSAMPIEHIDALHPHSIGVAYVNGQKIRVAFDTGADQSLLSLKAAARAGVTPESPGAVFSGYSRGIGRSMSREYIAPFASFKIGDAEEIKNTRLRIADIGLDNADMLLGADFFVSHRVFVANREHKIFLSYNGGPVFKLEQAPAVASTPAERPGDSDDPQDAAALARRGAALAARREFVPAIAELSRAIALNAEEPEYYYERANAYRSSGQADQAMADYDRSLSLKPDFLPSYLPRAEIRLERKDLPGAIAALEDVDRLAPKSADLRLTVAELYERMDRLPAAIEQYTLWIDNHPEDSRMGRAKGERCLSSALQDQDLPRALGDCDAALRLADRTNPNYSFLYADRGLVRLRQLAYAKAIADFGEALKIMPENARALYGRAVAEARQKDQAASEADLRAAQRSAPKIAERFERYGISP